MSRTLVDRAYLVPGQPHILLAHDRSPAWQSLYDAYGRVRQEIEKSDADLILYFSTQWLSVIGWLFQADPEPEWTHVDANWHDLGSIHYKFKVDAEFATTYATEARKFGYHTATVNYHGFPIDTGTIVAQKLLNPNNRLPAGMVSCNMYAEKDKTLNLGTVGAHALGVAGKKAIVVLVSNLSNRYYTHDIDPRKDAISSSKDDEWNRKIVELLGEGRLEDVDQCAREFAREANGDMGFKGIWWLNGLLGQSNDFKGQVYDYQPVWGTGCAIVGLTPTRPVPVRAPDPTRTEDVEPWKRMGKSKPGPQPAQRPLESPIVVSSRSLAATPAGAAGEGRIESRKAPEPVGAYPHARRIGDMLYLSGVGPRKRGTKEIPGVTLDKNGRITSYDVEIQTRSVIENVKTILEEAGSSMDKIVDVTVYLTNMEKDFPVYNRVYNEVFQEIGATRTTLGITALPTPIAVEFKVIARV